MGREQAEVLQASAEPWLLRGSCRCCHGRGQAGAALHSCRACFDSWPPASAHGEAKCSPMLVRSLWPDGAFNKQKSHGRQGAAQSARWAWRHRLKSCWCRESLAASREHLWKENYNAGNMYYVFYMCVWMCVYVYIYMYIKYSIEIDGMATGVLGYSVSEEQSVVQGWQLAWLYHEVSWPSCT